MGLSSKSGKAVTDYMNPQAFAVCDICGDWYNHSMLRWQHQWTGPEIQNLRLLACPVCLDTPNEQLRSIFIPPDPVPIENPRLEPFQQDASANAPTQWDTPNTYWDSSINNVQNAWDNVDEYSNVVPE